MAELFSYTENNHTYQVLLYFRRKPDLTREQCWDYLENVHGPLCVPWAEKYFISYRLVLGVL